MTKHNRIDYVQRHKKLTSLLESGKTVLLVALVVCLVAQIVVYIRGTYIYRSVTSSGSLNSFDKLWNVQSGASSEGLDGDRLLPEFIGYKLPSSQPMCSVADRESTTELYELVKSCILELFGSESICRRLPDSEGARIFDEAVNSEEYIYIRYHEPVLYQLIYAYAADRLTISESDVAVHSSMSADTEFSGAYVSELIIVPDKKFAYHRSIAYATDGQGNYYEFSQNDSVMASDFFISKLDVSAQAITIYPFTFDATFASTQYMLDEELETEDISVEPVTVNGELSTPLLKLLGYNPDKISSYEDDGLTVYVDAYSRLKLSESHLLYQASDESHGVKLNSLLDYTNSDSLNLFDKLTAVDNLIRRLGVISSDLVGREASLCLGEIYNEDGLLVIEYFLTYQNIRIDGDVCLRAKLSQDRLCELEFTPRSVTGSGETSLSPQQSYILRKLSDTGQIPADSELSAMRMRYRDGTAAWTVSLSRTVALSRTVSLSK